MPQDICVSSPYALDSPKGNSVSANRIAGLIGGRACHGVPDVWPDVLIALHATKNAETVARYRREHQGKLIVFLTGTDLYSDIPRGEAMATRSMEMADVIVVAQSSSLADVPEEFRSKTKVCRKSVTLDLPEPKPLVEAGLLTVVGHLREVKDPLLTAKAIALKPDLNLKLIQLGACLEPEMEVLAESAMQQDSRYLWAGNVSRVEVVDWLCRSQLTINTSLAEGGANSVAEAILCGTPVLASRISGNVGLLGDDYAGYFEAQNERELAELIEKTQKDSSFLDLLKSQVIARQSDCLPESEAADWQKVLASI